MVFCAAAASDRIDELMAGGHAAQVARLHGLSRALWDAGRRGEMRAFAGRILDGETFATLAGQ